MDDIQAQARALGDPTRHALFQHISDAPAPIGVAELTSHLALNHNTIRQHLAMLESAGLIERFTETSPRRGRPRLLFRVDPASDGRWGVDGPAERLNVLLLELIDTGSSPEDVGRSDGRRSIDNIDPTADPVDTLVIQMARHGFDPELRQLDDGMEIVLKRCPFEASAITDPDTICGLHLGIARGVAEALGGLTVDELVRNDPHQAQCRLRCRRSDEAAVKADS